MERRSRGTDAGKYPLDKYPITYYIPYMNTTHEPNQYEELDDEYDYIPTPRSKPRNYRMATLNRQAGIINRYRRVGLIK